MTHEKTNGTKRSAEEAPPTTPTAKKVATSADKTDTKADGIVDLGGEIRITETFGVASNEIYELLLDEKRFSEVAGFPMSIGKELFKEYTCPGSTSQNVHLVPNKLIVQESWSTPASPRSTLIFKFTDTAGGECGILTKLDFTQINISKELAEQAEPIFRELFDKIRTYLKDEKGQKEKMRKGRNLCHFEIPCKDIERASKFYATVLDWQIEKWGDYTAFRSGPKTAPWGWVDGGFLDLTAPDATRTRASTIADYTQAAAYAPYFEAHPVEESEKKVEAAGGKVLKSKTKEWWGTVAECLDTEGNRFFLYSSPQ
ncbi:hypothetical protein HDV00_001793 [Rhizophlyctis rosea]|nr:hypothetical protein HDV00_001793 [Rhizophlyctis rosea]